MVDLKRSRLTKDAINIIAGANAIQFQELKGKTVLRFEDENGNFGYILSVDGDYHHVDDRKKTIRSIKRIRPDLIISEFRG